MRHLVYIIVFAIVPTGWCAAGERVTMSLQECVRAAIANNLAMQSGRVAVRRAEEMQGSAFNIGRTTIALGQDPTSGGSPDNSFSLAQGFDFPTLYASRLALLKAETGVERENLEVTRNEVAREVTALYYRLLYERERVGILRQQDTLYARFLLLATAKFAAGETNSLERMSAERLRDENALELRRAESDFRAAGLALQRVMNADEVVEPADSVLPVAEVGALAAFVAGEAPVARLLGERVKVGEKGLGVARQGFLPDFSVTLRRQFLLPGYNPYDVPRERFAKGNFTGFEVGVSLPLFFGEQRAKTRAAKRDLEIARTRREEAVVALDNNYRVAVDAHATARMALDYYRERGSEQAREIARVSRLAYEKGEIGYVEYVQNLESAAALRLRHAGAINEYNQTVVILNYLQGNQ
ncbi:MAG: TolC family protein [Odoribacteraceae bacterium]|jgi:cobalt-zinc-cadmium resistance protein CzcA|nr:TolC family protein [Odoribacteraceae bacterium]